jgi:primosomal protein N' (replication factor Y)
MSLYASDYRASEGTLQLLTQAAGRAGRGQKEGNVVIQSYQPEHYSIVAASGQDYHAFYEEEIAYRDLLRYPPVSHMMCVQLFSRDEDEGMQFATRLRAIMEQQKVPQAGVIGPAMAAISRINDIYRMAVYVKLDDYEALVRLKDILEGYIRELEDMGKLRNISVQFDFDPMRG